MATDSTELTFVRCPSCRSLVPAVSTRCRMCGTALDAAGGVEEGGAPKTSGRVRQKTMSYSGGDLSELREDIGGDPISAPPGVIPSTPPSLSVAEAIPDPEISIPVPPVSVAPAAPTPTVPPVVAVSVDSDPLSGFLEEIEEAEPAISSGNGAATSKSSPEVKESAPLAPPPVAVTPRQEVPPVSPRVGADEREEKPRVIVEQGGKKGAGKGLSFGGGKSREEPSAPRQDAPVERPATRESREERSQREDRLAREDRPVRETPREERREDRPERKESRDDRARGGAPREDRRDDRREGRDDRRESREDRPALRGDTPREPRQERREDQERVREPRDDRRAHQDRPQRAWPEKQADRSREEGAESLKAPESSRGKEPPRREEAIHGGGSPIAARVEGRSGRLLGWFVNYADPDGSAIELREGRFFVSGSKLKPTDLVVADPSVSTPHALIIADGSAGIQVQDLMSERGVFVRSRDEGVYRREYDTASVVHGDWVRFGDVEFLVSLIAHPGVK